MSDRLTSAEVIASGRATLGVEFGSTRIKACLIGEDPGVVLASGWHEWENELVDGLWTYSLDDVWSGVQDAYAQLVADVFRRYEVKLTALRAVGVSAMMHGYLAFGSDDELLVPFRTWRNTNTGPAAGALSELFETNIPLRWSIAHFYEAILDDEPHVSEVRYLTTLAGYVHWRLTGRKVIGVGDGSGMFPIDVASGDYDGELLARFDQLVAGRGIELRKLLPEVLAAGADGGALTADGAALLDASGALAPGALLCPPEGDAGTGMVATNSVAVRTGNVSAGTSIFAMVVLERWPAHTHSELDLVTTPAGDPVAMVHCNNGASELAAWVELFARFAQVCGEAVGGESGRSLSDDAVYELLFTEALAGEANGGGLLAYNHLSGEPIAELEAGRPLIVRTPDSRLTLANFMRAQLYGVFATLALGMRVLASEGVAIERMFAHGGMFRTAGVAQRFLAAALGAPVAVADSASEGGAWGMAVLAAYAAEVHATDQGKSAPAEDVLTLGAYLDEQVFRSAAVSVVDPDPADVAGFAAYLDRYRAGLAAERAAAAL